MMGGNQTWSPGLCDAVRLEIISAKPYSTPSIPCGSSNDLPQRLFEIDQSECSEEFNQKFGRMQSLLFLFGTFDANEAKSICGLSILPYWQTLVENFRMLSMQLNSACAKDAGQSLSA